MNCHLSNCTKTGRDGRVTTLAKCAASRRGQRGPLARTSPRSYPRHSPWHGSEAHAQQLLGSAGPRASRRASRRQVVPPPTPCTPNPAQLLPAWKPCTLHGAPRYPEECALLQEDRHEGQQGPLRGRQGEGSSEGEDSRCAAHAPALLRPCPASSPQPPPPQPTSCLGAVLRHALCAHATAHHRPPRSMPEPSGRLLGRSSRILRSKSHPLPNCGAQVGPRPASRPIENPAAGAAPAGATRPSTDQTG